MKKKSILATAVVFAMCCGLMLTSCNDNEKDFHAPKKSGTVDLYSSYNYLGIIHNAFLTNVDRNFEWNDNISSLSEAIDYLSSFNKGFAMRTNLYGFDEREFINGLEEAKNGYCDSTICEDLHSGSLDRNLNYLQSNDLITREDLNMVNHLIDICYRQSQNEISIVEYNRELKNLESQWQRIYADDNKRLTDFSAIILNISVASADWWIENPVSHAEVPPVVARDAAGAIVGAVTNVVTSGGKTNGKSVGKAALSGAVTASVGAVAKVAKVINKLSKLFH